MALEDGLLFFFKLGDNLDTLGIGPWNNLDGFGVTYFSSGFGLIGDALAVGGFHGSSALGYLYKNNVQDFKLFGNIRTYGLWFYPTTFAGTPTIFCNWYVNYGIPEYELRHDGSNLIFRLWDTNLGFRTITFPNAVPLNTWTFFSFTYDVTNGSVTARVNADAPLTAHADIGASNLQFLLGNAGSNDKQFNGGIGMLSMWNRVLTPAEQVTFYNGGQGMELPFPAGGGGDVVSAAPMFLLA